MSSVYVYLVIGVSRPVLTIYVQPFPRKWNLSSHHIINEWVPSRCVQHVGRGKGLKDLFGYDFPTFSWVRVGLSFSTTFVLVGVTLGLPMRLLGPLEGPSPISFFFISSFSLQRAKISSSFFFFISSISLRRNIICVICSTSYIFSFTLLLVDTIWSLPPSNSLDPTMAANCSRTGLEPRELFPSFSVSRYALPFFLSNEALLHHLSPFGSSPTWSRDSNGTCKKHSNAQVRLRHLVHSVISTGWWRIWFFKSMLIYIIIMSHLLLDKIKDLIYN